MTVSKSIKDMLHQAHGMCDTKDVTPWENKFLKSIWDWTKNGAAPSFLTAGQAETLQKIWEKHFA